MTANSIIIDGVDVSGCPEFNRETGFCKSAYRPEQEPYCQDFDCCYKQLQKKTQECEKLLELYEPLNDEYFNGLDIKTIAELAKKSIRLTAENIEKEKEKENEELKIQISSLRNHISQLLEEKEDEANLSPKP